MPGGMGACRRGVNRSAEAGGTVNGSANGAAGSNASEGSLLSFPTGVDTPPLLSAITVVVIAVVTHEGVGGGSYDTSVRRACRTAC